MSKGEAIHIVLETVQGARIVCGNKWMCIDNGSYTVYSREYGQKKTRTLIITGTESEATDILTKDE
jgi:hypothetical protein